MNTNEDGYLRMLASALRGRNYAHSIPLLQIRGSVWRCVFGWVGGMLNETILHHMLFRLFVQQHTIT